MTRPVWARIDLQALVRNFALARSAAPRSRIMAVIKANAYGHGAVAVSRALDQADAFAVACVEEAMQLRESGIQEDIVLLEGVFEPAELQLAAKHRFDVVVHTAEQVAWLEKLDRAAGVSVWMKINTGMNRLGFSPSEATAVWQRLRHLPCIKAGGALRCMSHLSCADEVDSPATSAQLRRFSGCLNALASEGQGTIQSSLANSAALLTRPDTHFDWVRPGIMLYGASPMASGHVAAGVLQPVMSFESELLAVHRRRRGDAIGYGQSWVCPQDMHVGVVAVGYADGYPRHAPPGTPLLVNGEPAGVVGRVSMDMLCVDLRSQPQAGPGDPVVLWGKGLPVERVAELAGTISYELLCGVGERVPRLYLNATPD